MGEDGKVIPDVQAGKLVCPDGGACHHGCGSVDVCFRVRTCEPLSNVFPNDEWPEGLRSKAIIGRARQTLSYYDGREDQLAPNVRKHIETLIAESSLIEVEPWEECANGVKSLFVGGRFDGQVLGVANFREDATPIDYCPLETWGRTSVRDPWGRVGPVGRVVPLYQRFEVAFARDIAPWAWTNERVMEALAKALGALWTST